MNNHLKLGSRSFTGVLAVLTALTSLSIDMNLPALPQMARGFEVSVAAVQLTLSLFLLGFAIGQLVCGPLSDRVGRRPVLMGGLLLFALAGFGCAASPSLFWLVSARFVQGLGASVGPVLARAIVRDCYEHQEASAMLSQITQVMIIAPLLAPLLGGYLLVWFGWPAVFLVLGTCGLIVAMICWRVLPETRPLEAIQSEERAGLRRDLRLVLGHGPTLRHILTSCFAFAGMFAYISASPFVAIQIFHVARQNFGYVFALTAAALMVGATLNRRFVEHYSPLVLLRRGMICILAAGWLLVAFAWAHFGGLAGVVGPMMLYMVGQGLVQPNAMASAMAPHGRLAGLASALTGGLQTAAGSLAGYLVGAFYNGTSVPLAMIVAIMATAAWLVLDRSSISTTSRENKAKTRDDSGRLLAKKGA